MTEGLVRKCQNEQQLAAVLAQELGKMVAEQSYVAASGPGRSPTWSGESFTSSARSRRAATAPTPLRGRGQQMIRSSSVGSPPRSAQV